MRNQLTTVRLDPVTHMLACLHEAAHCVLLHVLGFKVLGASVIGEGEKFINTVGTTEWICNYNEQNPEIIERMAIGYCAGYVCEMLVHGIERFDAEDVIQFCNRDGGYEAGYAAHCCEFIVGDDVFEGVIKKTKRLLLMPDISNAVFSLASILNSQGKIDHKHIAEAVCLSVKIARQI